jgi:CubicO group peptidase (beta-lactamase class C family)
MRHENANNGSSRRGFVALCAERSANPKSTRDALSNRVDTRRAVGIEAGLLTPEGRTFASAGAVAKGGPAPAKDTMFEIGSMTKVFTALLLAERDEVALDDPVSKYLPESVKVPSRNGWRIWSPTPPDCRGCPPT